MTILRNNSILFIILIVGYSILMAGLFRWQTDRVFSLINVDSQKEVVRLAVSYNKRLYRSAEEDAVKEELRKEMTVLQDEEAFVWLLGSYRSRIDRSLLFSLVLFITGGIAAAGMLFFFSSKKITAPLYEMITSLEAWALTSRINPVRVPKRGGMKMFLERYNDLLQSLHRARVRARITDGVRAWKTTARMMVHEIRNQLSPLTLTLETITHYESSGEYKDELAACIHRTKTMEAILTAMRDFVNIPEPGISNVDLCEVIRKTGKQFPELDVSMTDEIKLHRETDPFYFELIVTNILKNAREAGATKTDIESKAENNVPEIVFCDNGSGIAEEIRGKISKPGFTTKKDGDGMGLFIIREIADCLGIDVDISSEEGKGTEVRLTWREE